MASRSTIGLLAASTASIALLALAIRPGRALGAPSAAAVRACVELNLPRYSNPGTAVVAQYSDIETTCRAALEDGDRLGPVRSAVGRDRSGGAGTASPEGGTGSGGGTTSPPLRGGSATSLQRQPPARRPPARARHEPPGDEPATTDSSASTPRPTSAPVVAKAIASADAGAGSPLPSSLAGGPAWLLIAPRCRRRRRHRRGGDGHTAAPELSTTAPLPLVATESARFTPAAALATVAMLSPLVAALLLAFPSGGYFIADWGVASIVLLASPRRDRAGARRRLPRRALGRRRPVGPRRAGRLAGDLERVGLPALRRDACDEPDAPLRRGVRPGAGRGASRLRISPPAVEPPSRAAPSSPRTRSARACCPT